MLLSTTSAADSRNQEATLMFQAIACILDDTLSENSTLLPQHLQNFFKSFIEDLSTVAREYFECHVRGSQSPPKPYTGPKSVQISTSIQDIGQKPINTTQARIVGGKLLQKTPIAFPDQRPHQRPKSFSDAVKSQQQNQSAIALQKPSKIIRNKVQSKSPLSEDNRLLVCVTSGHPALSMSPYAIMLQLNSFLGEKLVREIQTIKTGFAICPVSTAAQEMLITRMNDIETYLSTKGQCKVEKPENSIAYRISGVPQSYAGYNGTSIDHIKITAADISEALLDLTNIAPLKVLESRGSSETEFSDKKSWIVIYPKGHKLSGNLPLFGVRVRVKHLPRRLRTPQCGNCFGWHNERACARLPRCRLCGSTQHIESEHVSCDPTRDHQCPPKCVNCHGPHAADSLECLIRPRKDQSMPSKSEISQIRQAASAARLRLQAAHCDSIKTQTSDVNNLNTTTNLPPSIETMEERPSTPPNAWSLFSNSPSPNRGRYAALSDLSQECHQNSMTEIYEN